MRTILFIITIITLTACGFNGNNISMTEGINVEKSLHGKIGSVDVGLFTITNSHGTEVRISEYGGIITHLFAKDKQGKLDDVVLGFDSLDGYLGDHPYFGAIVGRYANRINKGKFELEGKKYSIQPLFGEHSLHGGLKGFDKHIWQGEILNNDKEQGIKLTRVSPDMEEGFPGNLKTEVKYLLDDQNQLKIIYKATSDKTTIVNLTNHSYFNLAGAGNGDILKQELMIEADYITPVNESLIPTGKTMTVTNTPFDFRLRTAIGDRINHGHDQIEYGSGYDHNYIRNGGKGLRKIAEVYDPNSGRLLSVISSEPGVQLYTANHLSNIKGKNGKVYDERTAFCLETQHYPDSPNRPNFPTTKLEAGDIYLSRTIYKFDIE